MNHQLEGVHVNSMHPLEITEAFLQENVSLASVSSLKIGGPARFFIRAKNSFALQNAVRWAKENVSRWVVMGMGSNVLFDDRGYDGLVIALDQEDEFSLLHEQDSTVSICASAGWRLAKLASKCARQRWAGLEFGCGIPGSLGGAIFMNAGAHGQEISSAIEQVEFLDEFGQLQWLKKEDLEFSYRRSVFHDHPQWVISRAHLRLQYDDEVVLRLAQWANYRRKTQPYNSPSAGCFFRNPSKKAVGQSAGFLIESLGLKGYRMGSIAVSELHANFIIHQNQIEKGSSSAVLKLVDHIRKEVMRRYAIYLESEVRYLPPEGASFERI